MTWPFPRVERHDGRYWRHSGDINDHNAAYVRRARTQNVEVSAAGSGHFFHSLM